MAGSSKSVWGGSIFAVLILLFISSGINGTFSAESKPVDRPLIDSRNHNIGRDVRCVIWDSGQVTEYPHRAKPISIRKSAAGKVIATLDSAKLDSIRKLIKIAAEGLVAGPEAVSTGTVAGSFSAWIKAGQAVPSTLDEIFLFRWGGMPLVNRSEATRELVELLVTIFKGTDCPGAGLDIPSGLLSYPRNTQKVLGTEWRKSDVWPKSGWTAAVFEAEVRRYSPPGAYNILKDGENARVILSPFIGVMDGPFSTPTLTYWVGPDMIAAAPRLRAIIARALAEALAGRSDGWDFDTDVGLIEVERRGDWVCDVGAGCYPESLVIATRPMEVDEAKALCRKLHHMDKVCAVINKAQ